jgi:hypothetical protein
MQHIDGFRTTDSFRFDRNTSSSSISLSSSSGYGSRLSLSQTDHSSSNRRIGITKYFKEKISRHKSLASVILSSKPEINNQHQTEIYESVWNLDEQINKIRSKINQQIHSDCQSMISMSVDEPEQIHNQNQIDNDEELLSAAPWYQQGLSRDICEEYLNDNNKPIGSFIIRHSYTYPKYPFVISIKTKLSLVEHFLIERTIDNNGYRFQVCFKYKILTSLI